MCNTLHKYVCTYVTKKTYKTVGNPTLECLWNSMDTVKPAVTNKWNVLIANVLWRKWV